MSVTANSIYTTREPAELPVEGEMETMGTAWYSGIVDHTGLTRWLSSGSDEAWYEARLTLQQAWKGFAAWHKMHIHAYIHVHEEGSPTGYFSERDASLMRPCDAG